MQPLAREQQHRIGRIALLPGTHLAYAARSSDFLVCGCVPDRVGELRAGLSPAERDAAIDAGEFTSRYFMPKVIQPCIGSMMRKTYGEDCPDLAASLKVNAEKFCPCMQSEVAQFTEAELVQLGFESANYVPLAAQAQKEGRNPPPAPPLFKRFTAKQAGAPVISLRTVCRFAVPDRRATVMRRIILASEYIQRPAAQWARIEKQALVLDFIPRPSEYHRVKSIAGAPP